MFDDLQGRTDGIRELDSVITPAVENAEDEFSNGIGRPSAGIDQLGPGRHRTKILIAPIRFDQPFQRFERQIVSANDQGKPSENCIHGFRIANPKEVGGKRLEHFHPIAAGLVAYLIHESRVGVECQ